MVTVQMSHRMVSKAIQKAAKWPLGGKTGGPESRYRSLEFQVVKPLRQLAGAWRIVN